MSMARRSGGRGRMPFPVGRRRHVPVVDSGCGCRPLQPRLLSWSSLLLWPVSACKQPTAAAATARGVSHSSPYYFRSSSSATSFSSSSAATHSTGSSAAICYSSLGRHQHGAGKKEEVVKVAKASSSSSSPGKRPSPTPSRKKKTAAQEDDGVVGVAVEKESSDPRADFRESMVQMVVEMQLSHWDDLRCMLRRLLSLNAPRHHAAILTAFAEVCAQIAATAAAVRPSPALATDPVFQAPPGGVDELQGEFTAR
ncbi:hypothetical protein ABZP36_008501 [Zizania latifolia]